MRNGCIVIAAILALTLPACDLIPGTPRNQAREALRGMMFDPGAAKIEFVAETADAVCGTVNGKNRMGAYVGASPFVFRKSIGYVEVYGGDVEGSDLRMLSLTDTDDPDWDKSYGEIDAKCRFPKTWKAMCGVAPGPTESDICQTWSREGGFMELMNKYDYRR
ncbi:hypothetical protein [Caulobacter sp. NIBR1757]|uniref:hypothetical protein n=1 Tax=Caulobacter sp. NIBR1757 TaxID=3016000 RepID=UPI0022F0D606|nr:hypothetical protein [Caulobacter sp. NIBR1757]WGM40989.1 hypothetical protein AMEJIAPC_03936 [Caulobacter sp. NIBR1757]